MKKAIVYLFVHIIFFILILCIYLILCVSNVYMPYKIWIKISLKLRIFNYKQFNIFFRKKKQSPYYLIYHKVCVKN